MPEIKKISFNGSFFNRITHPLILGAFSFSWIFYYFFMPPVFGDPDTPWHLAAGDLIRSTGHIINPNTWSFISPDHPWYNLAWLWDLRLSIINSLLGLQGLFHSQLVVQSVIIAALAYAVIRRGKASFDPIIIILALAVIAMIHFPGVRPQSFTFLMVIIFHHLLHKSRTNYRLPYILPVLAILWDNMHGGGIAGFTLIGAYAFEAYVTKKIKWLKSLLVSFIGCMLAILVTPLGRGVITGLLGTLGNGITLQIAEWRSYQFLSFLGLDFFLISYLLAAPLHDKKISIADKLISSFWLAASLIATRNSMIFILVSAPLLAERLERILPHKSTFNPNRKRYRFYIPIAFAVIAILATHFPLRMYVTGKNNIIDPKMVPVQEMAFLKKNYPGFPVINSYEYGGYMIYFNGKTNPILQDGRAATAYPSQVTSSPFINQDDYIKDYRQKHGAKAILINKSSRLFAGSDERVNWRKVFSGPIADVYIRSDLARKIPAD